MCLQNLIKILLPEGCLPSLTRGLRPADWSIYYLKKIKATYWTDSRTHWWLSASDYCDEGAWHWCYGNQQVQFFDNSMNHFVSGEPSNLGSGEHCGILKDTDIFYNMGVNDLYCVNLNSFICEVQKDHSKMSVNLFTIILGSN